MAYRPEQDSATLGHGHVAHAVRGERLVPVVNLFSLRVPQQLFAEFGVIGGDNTWLEHDQLKLKPAVSSRASKNTLEAPMAQEINRTTTTVFFKGRSSTAREMAAILINGLQFKGSMNALGCTLSNLQLRQVLLLSRKLSSDVWMWCGAVFGSHQDFCQAVTADLEHEVRLHCESVHLCACSNIEVRLRMQSHHVHRQ